MLEELTGTSGMRRRLHRDDKRHICYESNTRLSDWSFFPWGGGALKSSGKENDPSRLLPCALGLVIPSLRVTCQLFFCPKKREQ